MIDNWCVSKETKSFQHVNKINATTYCFSHRSKLISIQIRKIFEKVTKSNATNYSIYIYCQEGHAKNYGKLIDSYSFNDNIVFWRKNLVLDTLEGKIHLEKIFSITDAYFNFSDKMKEKIAKTFNLRFYALDSRFQCMKTYLKTKTIFTVFLCLHRLKSKIIIPRFLKIEVMCFLFQSRLPNNQFLNHYTFACNDQD